MSDTTHNGPCRAAWTLPPNLHQDFQELCALSTTGELTAEVSARLSEHLLHCRACRKLKEQYERVAGSLMPALAADAVGEPDEETALGSWSIEDAEATLMVSLCAEPAPMRSSTLGPPPTSRWKQACRYAIAAMILVTCGLGGYRIGILQARGPAAVAVPPTISTPRRAPQVTQRAVSAVPVQARTRAPADNEIGRLREELLQNQIESAKLKDQLSKLEGDVALRSTDLDRLTQERSDLSQRLTQVEADELGLQARLDLIGRQSAQDTAQSLNLGAKVNDLNAALEEKNREIAQAQQLLDHDRDIRNVIGARNLYIAEIYDVAKNGDTRKPFGRIFYTKDKSLIFYGYDLDQQKGMRKDASFQAWGRRGSDGKHDVSLGLLYQDDSNQKRWVLKFNDAKTISEIDAVFVTVEPEGGSAKPSSKPLLFTYLHLDPNHP